MPNRDKKGPIGNRTGFGQGGCEDKQNNVLAQEDFGMGRGFKRGRRCNQGFNCDFVGSDEKEFLKNKIQYFQNRLDEISKKS